jgi:hypothetical protein
MYHNGSDHDQDGNRAPRIVHEQIIRLLKALIRVSAASTRLEVSSILHKIPILRALVGPYKCVHKSRKRLLREVVSR